jgi:hypothetical protein
MMMKEDNSSRHHYFTYKFVNLVIIPISVGIEPLIWLSLMKLYQRRFNDDERRVEPLFQLTTLAFDSSFQFQ